jgi:hypothetical protein
VVRPTRGLVEPRSDADANPASGSGLQAVISATPTRINSLGKHWLQQLAFPYTVRLRRQVCASGTKRLPVGTERLPGCTATDPDCRYETDSATLGGVRTMRIFKTLTFIYRVFGIMLAPGAVIAVVFMGFGMEASPAASIILVVLIIGGALLGMAALAEQGFRRHGASARKR